MLMTANKFISFEGTEGAGKSTLIKGLVAHLEERELPFIVTREPGGSVFAEKIRSLLLDAKNVIADDSELLLMFAARADHLQSVIIPSLEQGKWVICDRFVDSSFAYQGYGQGQADAATMQKIQILTDLFVTKMPDLTFWLDLPVEQGMQRARKRAALDRFEQREIDFFKRVYQGYEWIYRNEPSRVKRIDASGTQKELLDAVVRTLFDTKGILR